MIDMGWLGYRFSWKFFLAVGHRHDLVLMAATMPWSSPWRSKPAGQKRTLI
jgi:hypothetical protein